MMTWYDGGLLPPKPEELGDEPLNADRRRDVDRHEGKLIYDTYGLNPRLLPKSLQDSVGERRRRSCRASRPATR